MLLHEKLQQHFYAELHIVGGEQNLECAVLLHKYLLNKLSFCGNFKCVVARWGYHDYKLELHIDCHHMSC